MHGGGALALILCVTLLLSIVPGVAMAEDSLLVEFPTHLETGTACTFWSNVTNDGESEVIITNVAIDVQGYDWMFPFGSDRVVLFSGNRTVSPSEKVTFEKDSWTGAVDGVMEVLVTIRFIEDGRSNETVHSQSFEVTFTIENGGFVDDDVPYQDSVEPNRLILFLSIFISFWALLMLAFLVRTSVYEFETKKTLEEKTIGSAQWFRYFDLIWWATGHKLAVVILYGLIAFSFSLIGIFLYF
jgi:hypothetical protein